MNNAKTVRKISVFAVLLCVLVSARVATASTLTVMNNANSGVGSLRQAVSDAAAGDTIVFDGSVTGSITLSTEIEISRNLTIIGPGAATLTITATSGSTRLFHIIGGPVSISGLTMSGVLVDPGWGAAIENSATLNIDLCVFSGNTAPNGGAIYNNAGTLNIDRSTFNGNKAGSFGGAIFNFNGGSITVTRSTFINNQNGSIAGGNLNGGAIANHTDSTLAVINSTFSGNQARFEGGAIRNVGTLVINNSTISGNSAGFCDQFRCAGSGGGIYLDPAGTATINNTIIAGNSTASGGNPDCFGSLSAGDYNLVQNATCSLTGTHNVTGQNPQLGPLQNNGGSTSTQALLGTSPAIDAGNSLTCATTDQRGFSRNSGSCDIGAFELQAAVCVAPPSGLVSWWTGDGTESDIKSGNNGILAGGAGYAAGKVGQGFNLSYPGYIDVVDSPNLHLANAMTVDAWVYRNASGNTFQTIVKKADDTHGFSLELNDATGRVSFFIFSDNGAGTYGWVPATSTTVLQANTWYHIAGTFDGSAVRIYVNGTLENSAAPFANTISWSFGHLNIGTDPSHLGDATRYWNGVIDEVQIFSRALTDAEIASLYSAGSAGTCKPLGSSLSVSPASGPYGGNATLQATLTRTSDSSGITGKTVDFTLNGNGVGSATTDASGIATLNSASLAGINGGTYGSGVGASFAGDSSFAASNGTAQLVVSPINQTINFTGPGTGAVGGSATLSATGGASGNPVVFSIDASSGAGVCNVSGTNGTTLNYTAAGSCVVDANQAGNANYSNASQVQRSVSVGQGSQTISFTGPGTGTLGGSATLSATGGASGNPVVFSIDATSGAGVCNVSGTNGTTLNYTAAGSCVVDANQAGNANYSNAAQVQQSVSVGQASQTISFTGPGTGAVGGSATLSATGGASGNPVVFSIDATSGAGVCNVSGTNGTTLNYTAAGNCVVDANQAGNANYSSASQVQQSVSVGQGSQTISFTGPGTGAVGGSATLSATGGASGNPVVFSIDASSGAGVCNVSGTNGTTLNYTAAGSCVVDANQAGNGNYSNASQVQQSVSVGKGSQTIIFTSTAPPAAVVGGATYGVTATGGPSGNAVTFTIGPAATSVCSLAGSTVSFTASGTCVINANQAGNTNYDAAAQAQQSFTVGKGSQTITFGPLSNAKLSQSPINVSATASSGLTVTFTTTTPAICTSGGPNGSVITLLATGTCSVKADQVGNTNYNAAPSVVQSFVVGNGKQDQTISFAALGARTMAQSPFTVSATATSGLTVKFSVTTPSVCSSGGANGANISLVAPGTCTVQADQSGSAAYNSAPSVTQSFNVTMATQTITFSSLANRPLSQSPFTATATSTSGLAVSFTSTTPSICTSSAKNGATIKLLARGVCTITASQGGNTVYSPASPVSQSFTVQ